MHMLAFTKTVFVLFFVKLFRASLSLSLEGKKLIPAKALKLVSYRKGLRSVVHCHCLGKSRFYHQALHLVSLHNMQTTSKHDKQMSQNLKDNFVN